MKMYLEIYLSLNNEALLCFSYKVINSAANDLVIFFNKPKNSFIRQIILHGSSPPLTSIFLKSSIKWFKYYCCSKKKQETEINLIYVVVSNSCIITAFMILIEKKKTTTIFYIIQLQYIFQ